MEESITVEVMLNDDVADDDDEGEGGFSASDARMFGLVMSPSTSAVGQSESRKTNSQSGLDIRLPQEPPGALMTDTDTEAAAASASATAAASASAASASDTRAEAFRIRGPSSGPSSDSDVSDVSSDVSSRLSPLTPSPDILLLKDILPPGQQQQQQPQRQRQQQQQQRQQSDSKKDDGIKGFITVAGNNLSASSHAIDKMTDAHLEHQQQQQLRDAPAAPSTATTVTTAAAATAASAVTTTSDAHLLIETDEDSAPPPPPSPPRPSLGARLKNLVCGVAVPPGQKPYVMTEEELGHMTVNNILYFTGLVVLAVLVYVLYADAF